MMELQRWADALDREPVTGRLLFQPAPLGEFALRNGLDPDVILADEDQSYALICEWYVAHQRAGGGDL